MILQLGLNDGNILKADVEYFFDLIKSPEKKLLWYESGHVLPVEYQARVLEWFEKHVK